MGIDTETHKNIDYNLMKKSIFKRETQRTMYNFVKEKVFRKNPFGNTTIYQTKIDSEIETISDSEEELFVCNLKMPMLEIDDKFYIEEKNITVTIKEKIRSSKDNVCYYVYPKIIEDNISMESKNKAEQLQSDYYVKDEINTKKINELLRINKHLEQFKGNIESGFWYRFIKKLKI